MDVQLPDGSIARFPDDMPETEIRTQLLKLAPPPSGEQRTAALRAQQQGEPYSGSILPFSKDAQGNVGFDSNAGLVGLAKRAITGAWSGATLPGDVASGQVDPMSDEAMKRSIELAAVASPMNPMVRSGDSFLANGPRALEKVRPQAPTQAQLEAAASQGFETAGKSGTMYSPEAVADMAASSRAALEAKGWFPEIAPKTHAALTRLENPPAGAVGADITGLHAARKNFRAAGRDFQNPEEQAASRLGVEALDRFITQPDPKSVLAGPAADAGAAWGDAVKNYAAAKRGEAIDDISTRATRRAEASNSGLNIDNSIRGRVASVLESPKLSAPFNAAEEAALEGVARGNPVRNSTRYVGNLLGGGGGLGASATAFMTGSALGSGPLATAGAVAPAVGWGLRKASNAMTDKELASVSAMARQRSPYYDQLLADAPSMPVSLDRQAAAIRALLEQFGVQQN